MRRTKLYRHGATIRLNAEQLLNFGKRAKLGRMCDTIGRNDQPAGLDDFMRCPSSLTHAFKFRKCTFSSEFWIPVEIFLMHREFLQEPVGRKGSERRFAPRDGNETSSFRGRDLSIGMCNDGTSRDQSLDEIRISGWCSNTNGDLV